MIVLDTNVMSALMRTTPEPAVVAWLDIQPPESIWTTSVCIFEIRYGLNILPPGRKRERLERAFDLTLTEDLESRVLDFDRPAALAAARISANFRTAGKNVEIRDVQIAGIVSTRQGTLATGNTKHFVEAGIALVNPWGS